MFKKATQILDKIYKFRLSNAASDDEKYWMEHKYNHSVTVLELGKKVLDADQDLAYVRENFYEEALASLLLHDIGRFYQFQPDSYETKTDHGVLGAEILRDDFKLDNKIIFLGVKYHDAFDFLSEMEEDDDYKELDDELKPVAIAVAKLIRDADKLENFQVYRKDNGIDLNIDKFDWPRELTLNASGLEYLYNGQLINRLGVTGTVTVLDRVIYRLAWCNELYYQTTKDIVRENKMAEFFMGLFYVAADAILAEQNNEENQLKYKEVMAEAENIKKYLLEADLVNKGA